MRDTAEFEEYVAMRWSACFRTAYLMTGDRGMAEDLVQTALSTCFVAWPKLRAREAADAYVRKAMLNTFLSWRRRTSWGREHATEVLPDRPGVDNSARIDEQHRLRDALAQLPPRQRAVVVMRFYDDLGVHDVAAAMGCSVGTVKSQTSDGLRKLRTLLDEDVEAPLDDSAMSMRGMR
jgi:RNA polymerase sigma-70 factor (sigma-E family)